MRGIRARAGEGVADERGGGALAGARGSALQRAELFDEPLQRQSTGPAVST